MAKIILLFLVISIASIISAEDAHQVYAAPSIDSTFNYTSTDRFHSFNEVSAPEEDYTELYTVLATSVFDFAAKLIRAEVKHILWIKKSFVEVAVPAFLHLKNWYINNQRQVDATVRAVVEFLQVFGGVFNIGHAADFHH